MPETLGTFSSRIAKIAPTGVGWRFGALPTNSSTSATISSAQATSRPLPTRQRLSCPEFW
jgi:hypothetical protein